MNATAALLLHRSHRRQLDDVNRTTCAARAVSPRDRRAAPATCPVPRTDRRCIAITHGQGASTSPTRLDGGSARWRRWSRTPTRSRSSARCARRTAGREAREILAWYEAERTRRTERINDAYGEVKRATAAAAHDVVDTVAAVVTVDDTAPDAADDPSGEPDIVDVKATVDDGVAAGDTATATDSAPRKRRTPNPAQQQEARPPVTAEQKSRTMAQSSPATSDSSAKEDRGVAPDRPSHHVATAERNIAQVSRPTLTSSGGRRTAPKVDEWPTYVERADKARRARPLGHARRAGDHEGDATRQKMPPRSTRLDDAKHHRAQGVDRGGADRRAGSGARVNHDEPRTRCAAPGTMRRCGATCAGTSRPRRSTTTRRRRMSRSRDDPADTHTDTSSSRRHFSDVTGEPLRASTPPLREAHFDRAGAPRGDVLGRSDAAPRSTAPVGVHVVADDVRNRRPRAGPGRA